MFSRRLFLSASSAALVSACVRSDGASRAADTPIPPLPAFYGAVTTEPYPIPAVPEGVIPPELWRQEVANPFPDQPAGTIIVDPDATHLHLVQSPESAMRYGVSVGAEGFAWNGPAVLQFRREWPTWKPPASMIARQPELAPYSVENGGMPPGPGNPLGARALYLFQNGRDTLYRIHGGCEPQLLGKAVSSGCIRLLDQDAIDIHARATDGARVIVLPSRKAVPSDGGFDQAVNET
jgi:lipoprotein-anchoring transpeptidase ErfK/SrfK